MKKKMKVISITYESVEDAQERMQKVIMMLLSKVKDISSDKQLCFALLAVLFYITLLPILLRITMLLF